MTSLDAPIALLERRAANTREPRPMSSSPGVISWMGAVASVLVFGCGSVSERPIEGNCVLTAELRCRDDLIPATTQAIMDFSADGTRPNSFTQQLALTNLLRNDDLVDLKGVVTNNPLGSTVQQQNAEAKRIALLLGRDDLPIVSGATGRFEDIVPHLDDAGYDGKDAVDLIVSTARAVPEGARLLIIVVGKGTNTALALRRAPEIIGRVTVIWHATNARDFDPSDDVAVLSEIDGEVFVTADPHAANYLWEQPVDLTLVPARGVTSRIGLTQDVVPDHLFCRGPRIPGGVATRDGTLAYTIGDHLAGGYSRVRNQRAIGAAVAAGFATGTTTATMTAERPAPRYDEGMGQLVYGSETRTIRYLISQPAEPGSEFRYVAGLNEYKIRCR